MKHLVFVIAFFLTGSLYAQLSTQEPPTAKYFLKEIERFDSLNQVTQYPQKTILFTGSSSIRLWSTLGDDLHPYPVIQRGFGGARIEDMDWYLERVVFPHQFRAIVFMVGSNNITGGNRDLPGDTILRYTHHIVEKVRSKYPGVPLFWIGITPTPSRLAVIEKVKAMNRTWKKDFRSLSHVYFIDTQRAFLDQSGKPRSELFVADQLHLNREGYRLWAKLIKKELDKHLRP